MGAGPLAKGRTATIGPSPHQINGFCFAASGQEGFAIGARTVLGRRPRCYTRAASSLATANVNSPPA